MGPLIVISYKGGVITPYISRDYNSLGGGNSKIFGIFTPNYLGKMNPHFDEHIFQRGWFNHQLDLQSGKLLLQWKIHQFKHGIYQER